MNRKTFTIISSTIVVAIILTEFALSQPTSWVQTQGPAGGEIKGLFVTSTGTILAGTEEGVHRSTNAGSSWSWASGTMTNRSISAFARDSAGTIFVGTGQGVIYKSSDDGLTWQVHPGLNPGSIYAIWCQGPGNLWISSWGGGVYRTTDNGTHWTNPDTGLTNRYVASLLVEGGGYILAGTTTSIFRSTNYGETWAPATNGWSSSTVYSILRHRSGDIFAATNGGMYRSTNNGDSWTKVIPGAARWVIADTTGLLLAGMFSGDVQRSTDGGTSWIPKSVSPGQVICGLAMSTSGLVYAGALGRGVFQSTDKGLTWAPRHDGLIAAIVTGLQRAPDNSMYAATYTSGLFRSTNSGLSWTYVPTVPGSDSYNCLALDDSARILAGTWGWGLLRQPVTGPSWETLVYGYFYCVTTSPGGVILAGNDVGRVLHSTDYGYTWSNDSVTNKGVFAVADGRDGHLYAGTVQDGIYRSTDSGRSWVQKNTGLSNLYVRALLPRQNGALLAGTDGGLFKSTDRGESWSFVTTGLYSLRALLPIGSQQLIAAGWRGVSFSSDGGTSWGLVNDGLWPPDGRSIAIDAVGYLYVGMANAGVFKSVATTGVGLDGKLDAPDRYALLQNYPNPFNSTTVIRFQLPAPSGVEGSGVSEVKLVVCDILGREVAVLMNERKEAGVHEVSFDGSSLASGVYFYRLIAGTLVQTRKMILVR